MVRCKTHGTTNSLTFKEKGEEVGKYCFLCLNDAIASRVENHADKK